MKDPRIEFTIVRKAEEHRVVYGWAYVSEDEQGVQVVDHSTEFIPIAELEKAQWHFVKEARAGGEMHEGEAGAVLVASLVFTDEIVKALGIAEDGVKRGWFVGFEVPEATFAKVKDGSRLMFSIEGTAQRTEVEA